MLSFESMNVSVSLSKPPKLMISVPAKPNIISRIEILFTVPDCDCNNQFHQCLREINSKDSNRIGRIIAIRNEKDASINKTSQLSFVVFFLGEMFRSVFAHGCCLLN